LRLQLLERVVDRLEFWFQIGHHLGLRNLGFLSHGGHIAHQTFPVGGHLGDRFF
jgi:hypothetical protein